jgi:multidrug transporter EmrE-like cation transporter
MNTSASAATYPPQSAARRWKAVLLVCFCTLLGAAAQILMKIGMTNFKLEPLALVTNFPLIAGYALYGLFTLLLVIALREGELSLLYPIISLGYVWVTGLSYFFFHDQLNTPKSIGIASIMIGVAVLGQGGKK